MLGQFDFLTIDESQAIRNKIYSLQHHWINRASGLEPFYTLGTASYLDSPDANDTLYLQKAQKTNPILLENFSLVYERLKTLLSNIMKIPVLYETKLALPGFHIFKYSKSFEKPIAKIHFDLQFKSHQWSHYKKADLNNPLSFTCPVALPHVGGGLNYWDIFRDDVKEMDESQFTQYIATKQMHYLPYTIGKIALHKGLLLHQIAPAKSMNVQDERITLQGHGIIADGALHLYW